jgi:hypothetical protein
LKFGFVYRIFREKDKMMSDPDKNRVSEFMGLEREKIGV